MRTPITNLILRIESINQKTDLIPDEIIEDILKIESETYRLKRLAQKSTSYLHSHEKNMHLKFEMKKIESLKELLESYLENADKKVIRLHMPEDYNLIIDPYWLQICFKNIIENSLSHGQIPIDIRILKKNKHIGISICDHGVFKPKNLQAVLSNKYAHPQTDHSGLGIGLSIVVRILKSMKAHLELKKNPTTLIIWIKDPL